MIWWFLAIYEHFTVIGPAKGGQYIEATTGQPQLINPLLAPGSSASSDRLLAKLIYNGLYTYDQDGKLVQDLAEEFERSEDGKRYTVKLREGVKWHDGEDFTADDVVFTFNTVRDGSYDSIVSALKVVWRDVQVEKKDDLTVEFTLEKQRGDFLHLLTLGILPQHVWKDVSAVQFQLAPFNIRPIGTGPYSYVTHVTDDSGVVDSYTLLAYDDYHHGEPLITKFVMQVYPDRASAISAYTDGVVSGVTADTRSSIDQLRSVNDSETILKRPSYFGVFFNQTKSKSLAFKEVRQALLYALDRDAIVDEVFGVSAFPVSSPLFDGMEGFVKASEQPSHDLQKARTILDEGDGKKIKWPVGPNGIRELTEGNEKTPLAFKIAVTSDREQLVRTAEIIAQQWREIGADVVVDARPSDEFEVDVLKSREYDAILTFHPMRWDQPNLFALWHSKEKGYPGLNYSVMQDGPIDNALEALQAESSDEPRRLLYEQVQSRIKVEDPAAFLFATSFLFAYESSLKGVELRRVNAPQDRFSHVHKWYVREKRQLK